jgi:hypothetical protein
MVHHRSAESSIAGLRMLRRGGLNPRGHHGTCGDPATQLQAIVNGRFRSPFSLRQALSLRETNSSSMFWRRFR